MPILFKKFEGVNHLKTFAIMILCLCVIITMNYNFRIVIVSGDSMIPTLKSGQLVIIRKHVDSFESGDIVVFHHQDELMIKRVIALPGDQVILDSSGIYINGIHIKPYNYSGEPTVISLNEDDVFVIGDNYDNSIDSRIIGPISIGDVIGVVLRKTI